MNKKFVLRHWRGNGQVIPDLMKDSYYDYPKKSMNRNARRYSLAECIVKVITFEEFKEDMIKTWGQESLDRFLRKHKLN